VATSPVFIEAVIPNFLVLHTVFATEVPVQLGLHLNLQVFATLKYRFCHAKMQDVTLYTAENLLTVQLKLQRTNSVT
jgi:hypothetical protein